MRATNDHAVPIVIPQTSEWQRLRERWIERAREQSMETRGLGPCDWCGDPDDTHYFHDMKQTLCEGCYDHFQDVSVVQRPEPKGARLDMALWVLVVCGALAAWILVARFYGWAPWSF